MNSTHPSFSQTARQSAQAHWSSAFCRLELFKNGQVRAHDRGKGQWIEMQGSCSLYITLWLWPAAAACSSCLWCRLSILTVQEEFVQFLESTVCTRARPGSVSNMTLQMIGSSWCLNTAGTRLRLFYLCIKASREFELILRKNHHIWSVIKLSRPLLFTVLPPMDLDQIKKKKKKSSTWLEWFYQDLDHFSYTYCKIWRCIRYQRSLQSHKFLHC